MFGGKTVMERIWVIDGHCDSLGAFLDGTRSLCTSDEVGHWDLGRARQGAIGLQFMAAFIESQYKPALAVWRGMQLIEAAHKFVRENQEQTFLIKTRSDLERVPDPTKVGLLLSVEGGEVIGENIFMVDIIFKLGVRALGLTWNQRNALAEGVGEDSGSGLTKLGLAVVQRMNELGMVVDVAHLNQQGFWDVLEHSAAPVVASHSCARSLCDHPRNLTDAQLRALAAKGGVAGVNFYPGFLVESGKAHRQDVVRHIIHMAEVAGVESVGLGSDFDGIEEPPEQLENAGLYPELAADLERAGFTTQEINQIFHGNLMRLLQNVIK